MDFDRDVYLDGDLGWLLRVGDFFNFSFFDGVGSGARMSNSGFTVFVGVSEPEGASLQLFAQRKPNR